LLPFALQGGEEIGIGTDDNAITSMLRHFTAGRSRPVALSKRISEFCRLQFWEALGERSRYAAL
jgi:hypothetical protein